MPINNSSRNNLHSTSPIIMPAVILLIEVVIPRHRPVNKSNFKEVVSTKLTPLSTKSVTFIRYLSPATTLTSLKWVTTMGRVVPLQYLSQLHLQDSKRTKASRIPPSIRTSRWHKARTYPISSKSTILRWTPSTNNRPTRFTCHNTTLSKSNKWNLNHHLRPTYHSFSRVYRVM